VIGMLEEKRFPVDEMISMVVGMEEAPAALEAWSENPTRYSKIIVQVG
jgi:threonine dehydrogenase-like Zn-dependent dehydrogenase